MPLDRPTRKQLVDRARADFAARVDNLDPRVRRSLEDILIRVIAGAEDVLYGYVDRTGLQLYPDTATADNLDRLSTIYGVGRLESAFAEGICNVTGTNGTVLASGKVFVRSDGVTFELISPTTISGGTAACLLRAAAVGSASNTDASTVLAQQTSQAGVNAGMTVGSGGIIGGADAESDDSLRERLRRRMAQSPQGGSLSDFERWLLEVPGTTRRWVFLPASTDNLVTVRFVRDGDANIVPTAERLAEMQSYLDARRPLGSRVSVLAPTLVALALTINGINPDTTAVRAAISAELTDMLLRDGIPGGVLLLSRIREAISRAAGESDHVLTTPSANVTYSTGQLPTLGTITYT